MDVIRDTSESSPRRPQECDAVLSAGTVLLVGVGAGKHRAGCLLQIHEDRSDFQILRRTPSGDDGLAATEKDVLMAIFRAEAAEIVDMPT